MVDEKKVQFNAPVTKERRKKFAIWCKINDMSQEQGLAKLIDMGVTEYKLEVQ